MNKTLALILIVLLLFMLGCLIASQVTLEKIDEDLQHYDQVLERWENK